MSEIQAVVFDAYGTLFDVHSVVQCCDRLFPGRGRQLSQLWRSKQLEYTWLRSLMGRYEDFEAVTRAALSYACASLTLELNGAGSQTLMDEYLRLAPYPEAGEALQRLRGRKLAILSNGSPAMLEAVVRNAGLAAFFQAVLSVDEQRTYKPNPSVYRLAPERLGTQAGSIAFVSSNFWDVAGASSFGFRTFWINRFDALPEPLGFPPAGVLRRLDELPAALS